MGPEPSHQPPRVQQLISSTIHHPHPHARPLALKIPSQRVSCLSFPQVAIMVALPYSRTLAKQLLARSTRSFTRPASAPLLRVNCTCRANSEQANGRNGYRRLGLVLGQARSYATEATKPASRPKAHTGRASAKRNVSTKKAKSGTKATKKPKKKAIKKTKPKVKKAPSKTSLLKKERQRQSDLRATALLAPPKQLPQTAFTLVLVEEAKKGGGVKDRAVAASSKYRGLSSEEREVRRPLPQGCWIRRLIFCIAIQPRSQCQ